MASRSPISVLLLCYTTLLSSVSAIDVAAHDPHPSPKASTSLICPTEHASDCYPAIFQPTVKFQRIRPDQSIPPGLHVRLNLATGEKEARLNVPEPEDELDRGAIVVIDEGQAADEEVEEDIPLHLKLQDALAQEKHARPYSPPRPLSVDQTEATMYKDALSDLGRLQQPNVDPQLFLSALMRLTDLAHSLDWGLTITRDRELCTRLVNLIRDPVPAEKRIRSEAVLILGTAIQNNPEALTALLYHDDNERSSANHGQPTTQDSSVLMAATAVLAELGPFLTDVVDEDDATLAGRAVFLLNQLCADESQLMLWLGFGGLSKQPSGSDNGLSVLHKLFDTTHTHITELTTMNRIAEKLQKLAIRIANFITDHAEAIAASFESAGSTNNKMSMISAWCRTLTRSSVDLSDSNSSLSMLEARDELSRVLMLHGHESCKKIVSSEDEAPEL